MKSETEKQFDEADKRYYERFGEHYPIFWDEKTVFQDMIRDIDRRIKSGKPKRIKYPKGRSFVI